MSNFCPQSPTVNSQFESWSTLPFLSHFDGGPVVITRKHDEFYLSMIDHGKHSSPCTRSQKVPSKKLICLHECLWVLRTLSIDYKEYDFKENNFGNHVFEGEPMVVASGSQTTSSILLYPGCLGSSTPWSPLPVLSGRWTEHEVVKLQCLCNVAEGTHTIAHVTAALLLFHFSAGRLDMLRVVLKRP